VEKQFKLVVPNCSSKQRYISEKKISVKDAKQLLKVKQMMQEIS
jgi:hypothetical protein